MIKITFIYPDLSYFDDKRDWPGVFSLGLGYLSASVKKAGHMSSLIHIVKPIAKEEFYEKIDYHQPDLIAFSSMSHQYDMVRQLASWLKDEYNIPVIYGGVHPSINSEECINTTGIDMICIGEGEKVLVELLNRMDNGEDIKDIDSIWVKEDGKIYRNKVADLVEDIDEFPIPDREVFDYKNLWDYRERVLIVFATRGCPFNCSYCINHQYRRLYPNYKKYVRFRRPEKIIEEIKLLRDRYPEMRYIIFLDDSFCVKKSWLKDFLPLYKSEIGMPFYANTSINLLDEEVISCCVDAGVKEFAVGIESGNNTIRREVLGRKMSNEKILEIFRIANRYNLRLSSYNMVGIPNETLENTLETVKINAKVDSSAQHVAILQPYKFTDLYDLCKREGYLKDEKISSFFKESVLELPTISKDEIKFAYKYFMIFIRLYELVYKMPFKKISNFLERVLDWFYLNKRLKKFQMMIYPLSFLLVRPVKFARIYTLRYFPKTGYRIKRFLVGLKLMKKE